MCSILSTDYLHEADLAVWLGSLVLMGCMLDNSDGLLWVWGGHKNPCVWEWKAFFWFIHFCYIWLVPRQFPFTDTTLQIKSLSIYIKNKLCCNRWDMVLQGLSCCVNTEHNRSPLGTSSKFSGLKEQMGNLHSLLIVLKITHFFLKR